MGDRDKGDWTIELMEIVPFPKHSHGPEICPQVGLGSVDTSNGLRPGFHKYFLVPHALLQAQVLVVVVVLASSARATVLFLLLAGLQKRRQQNHNANVPVLRKKGPGKKLSRLPVGERKIE